MFVSWEIPELPRVSCCSTWWAWLLEECILLEEEAVAWGWQLLYIGILLRMRWFLRVVRWCVPIFSTWNFNLVAYTIEVPASQGCVYFNLASQPLTVMIVPRLAGACGFGYLCHWWIWQDGGIWSNSYSWGDGAADREYRQNWNHNLY